mgnify:CR=1 FL=1|jgi:hypothetical protein
MNSKVKDPLYKPPVSPKTKDLNAKFGAAQNITSGRKRTANKDSSQG